MKLRFRVIMEIPNEVSAMDAHLYIYDAIKSFGKGNDVDSVERVLSHCRVTIDAAVVMQNLEGKGLAKKHLADCVNAVYGKMGEVKDNETNS